MGAGGTKQTTKNKHLYLYLLSIISDLSLLIYHLLSITSYLSSLIYLPLSITSYLSPLIYHLLSIYHFLSITAHVSHSDACDVKPRKISLNQLRPLGQVHAEHAQLRRTHGAPARARFSHGQHGVGAQGKKKNSRGWGGEGRGGEHRKAKSLSHTHATFP